MGLIRKASTRRGTRAKSLRTSRSWPRRGCGKGSRGISGIKSNIGVLRNLQDVQQGQSQRPIERLHVVNLDSKLDIAPRFREGSLRTNQRESKPELDLELGACRATAARLVLKMAAHCCARHHPKGRPNSSTLSLSLRGLWPL